MACRRLDAPAGRASRSAYACPKGSGTSGPWCHCAGRPPARWPEGGQRRAAALGSPPHLPPPTPRLLPGGRTWPCAHDCGAGARDAGRARAAARYRRPLSRRGARPRLDPTEHQTDAPRPSTRAHDMTSGAARTCPRPWAPSYGGCPRPAAPSGARRGGRAQCARGGARPRCVRLWGMREHGGAGVCVGAAQRPHGHARGSAGRRARRLRGGPGRRAAPENVPTERAADNRRARWRGSSRWGRERWGCRCAPPCRALTCLL